MIKRDWFLWNLLHKPRGLFPPAVFIHTDHVRTEIKHSDMTEVAFMMEGVKMKEAWQ